jgi:predicted membrane chloride channel (bestrophin family)
MIAGGLCTLLTVGDELCRIRETPIPFAYRAHLWTATVIYFIIFPLNSYETFGWAMVPAAALLAYIYFGLLSIARDMYVFVFLRTPVVTDTFRLQAKPIRLRSQ